MKSISRILILICVSLAVQAQNADSIMIRKIFDEALSNGESYKNLEYLANEIGGRLSGSPEAKRAVDFTEKIMNELKVSKVFKQDVMVPHWTRGQQEISYVTVNNKQIKLNICALGGSIGTGDKGIEAEVIEVKGIDALKKLTEADVKGKIVFLNEPMDPTQYTTFIAYSNAVGQRWAGAMEAAKLGAKAVMVRSMSLKIDDYPHTGSMGYDDEIEKIPAVAVSTMGAEMLSRFMKEGAPLKVYIETYCETHEDKPSHNVVGQINGAKFKDEYIVVGGHLDAWDLGDGAHDCGAGCMQSIEVLRILKAIGYTPNRNIRAVMFMNEENGLRGGKKYAELSKTNNEKHIAAIESDAGGFTPLGFGMKTTDESKLAKMQSWEPLLKPYGLAYLIKGYGGADVNPLAEHGCTPMGLIPDSQRYFDYHHADSDTFDKVNQRELELGAASMAALVYLIDKYGL